MQWPWPNWSAPLVSQRRRPHVERLATLGLKLDFNRPVAAQHGGKFIRQPRFDVFIVSQVRTPERGRTFTDQFLEPTFLSRWMAIPPRENHVVAVLKREKELIRVPTM